MAFNNPYLYYQNPYMVQYQAQPTQQAHPVQNQQNYAQPQNQIQNGGLVTVPSEEVARNYPVALGTSVTFKHETAPYCYTKTMSFSQFDAPKFEKFRIVKEDDVPAEEAKEAPVVSYATKEDLGAVVAAMNGLDEMLSHVKGDIETIKTDMYGMAGRKKSKKSATGSTL